MVDWTGGLDWWTGLNIIFILPNESLPVGDIANFLHGLYHECSITR